MAGALAALLDRPGLRALGATAGGRRATGCACACAASETAAPGAASGAALAARVPAGAIAMLAAPDAAALRRRGRAGGRRRRGRVGPDARSREQASLDVDHDLVGALQGGFAAWLSRRRTPRR